MCIKLSHNSFEKASDRGGVNNLYHFKACAFEQIKDWGRCAKINWDTHYKQLVQTLPGAMSTGTRKEALQIQNTHSSHAQL